MTNHSVQAVQRAVQQCLLHVSGVESTRHALQQCRSNASWCHNLMHTFLGSRQQNTTKLGTAMHSAVSQAYVFGCTHGGLALQATDQHTQAGRAQRMLGVDRQALKVRRAAGYSSQVTLSEVYGGVHTCSNMLTWRTNHITAIRGPSCLYTPLPQPLQSMILVCKPAAARPDTL
jgi:hypothetical protein